MEPTKELIDDLYREKVLDARRTPPDVKLVSGLDLFEEVCERMCAGIRHQFPHFSEDQVQRELRRRLEINRLMSEQGLPEDVLELVSNLR